jgi:hypothetical protein
MDFRTETFVSEYLDSSDSLESPESNVQRKPSPKSVLVSPSPTTIHNPPENETQRRTRILSEYQEIGKKMSTQHSKTTQLLFSEQPDLWHQYHDTRDFSFQGYDDQNEIPVNKVIRYLKSRENRKLRILDLGCGRNLIAQYFADNQKFNVTGYDHVSCNGSVACDISELKEMDESVNVCVFSQSLMGSNWESYLEEAKRVLCYNGELIICDSIERYEIIKQVLITLDFKIQQDSYEHQSAMQIDEIPRWFFMTAINN